MSETWSLFGPVGISFLLLLLVNRCTSLPLPLKVYDNVLNLETSKSLFTSTHTSSLPTSQLRHVFKRTHPNNPIERTLDGILKELKDESPVVEYWSRDTWNNLEVHKDVDGENTQQRVHGINERNPNLFNNLKNEQFFEF